MRTLVLGTKSSSRRKVLESLGIKFIVVEPKGVSEILRGSPREVVLSNARAKTNYILKNYSLPDNALLMTFDTAVVVKGRILGKPGSKELAVKYLKLLRCRWHSIFTGVVITDKPTSKKSEFVVKTRVKMRCYSDTEIEEYVSTSEPLSRAGAYAIQSLGALLVERIEGDPYNVVGIPVARIQQELWRMGLDLFKLRQS